MPLVLLALLVVSSPRFHFFLSRLFFL
ncbi:hypothetical protein SSYM_0460, partial [Serratia symbiotica str. Tucson]